MFEYSIMVYYGIPYLFSISVCHAEMNAIVNKNSADVEGCTMFVSLFPCSECAKIIIQSGIKEVVYYSDKKQDSPATKAAIIMFDKAEVECRLVLVQLREVAQSQHYLGGGVNNWSQSEKGQKFLKCKVARLQEFHFDILESDGRTYGKTYHT